MESAASAEMQGIAVAILKTDGASERTRPSLRRTLSADMSSKKWAAQSGVCLSTPIKKIASSKDLRLNEDEEEEEGEGENSRGMFDIWTSIQLNNNSNKKQDESGGGVKKEFDIWSSIISQNSNSAEKSPASPPYVHPLVKRSSGSLSEKSLQVCTESLGSETGSEGFSSSSDTEFGFLKDVDSEADDEEAEEEEEYSTVKFCSGRKLAAARPFPPPLPSLSSRSGGDGGGTLHMRTRRDNGRLVVEAVTVPPSQPNFAAQRLDGRLVLKFAKTTHDDPKDEEFEEQFASETTEIETEEEEERQQQQEVVHEELRKKIESNTESRLINFHRLALMANKPIGLPSRNNSSTSWPEKGQSEFQQQQEEVHEKPSQLAASLPPRPRGPVGCRLIPPPALAKVSTTAAASFNHYDYFWRTKINDSNDNKLVFKSPTAQDDKRERFVSRGNGYLVPLLKGCCKQQPRAMIWEPRGCVATS